MPGKGFPHECGKVILSKRFHDTSAVLPGLHHHKDPLKQGTIRSKPDLEYVEVPSVFGRKPEGDQGGSAGFPRPGLSFTLNILY